MTKFKASRVCSVLNLENDDNSGLRFTLGSRHCYRQVYVSKLEDSFQAQTILALYNQEILRGGGNIDYHRLRMCVKLQIEQAQRSNNFRIQNKITERGAETEERGKIPPSARQITFSVESKCLAQDEYCSFLYKLASGNREITRKNCRLQEYLDLNQLSTE